MGIPDVIPYFDEFEGPNEWAPLSNFWQGRPIPFKGYVLLTGEHFFQALKARNPYDFKKVVACPTPAEAKQEGKHTLRLRPDWERVKYDVMRLVLGLKFTQDREEGSVLLATGSALLVEGNTWGDRVWGVDVKQARQDALKRDRGAGGWEAGEPWRTAPGRNWLGTLLMARRAELQAELAGGFKVDYGSVAEYVRYQPVRRTA